VLHGALGPIYEPLFFYNKTKDSEPIGLIGDSFEYNEDGTQITVKIKPDLKWSDGEPLTADDVVFSFQYEANNPEGNGLVSAEATDETTAGLTYSIPQYTTEFQRMGSSYILPEHIWKDVTDFANFANEDPVGSGPYVVDKTTSESYTLVANENYRGADELAVKKVQYIAVDNNQTAQDLLAAGELDWTGMFIPNPDDVTGNGKIDWINTPQDPTVLYTCSNAELGCTGPQTDVAVRQALNVAIDRSTIKDKAFVGLTGDISPAYTLLPRDEKWLADPANEVSPQEANVEEADSILEAAGYTKGSSGIYEKNGVPLELSLISVDGWTDYNDAAKLISAQAAEAGIRVNARTVSEAEYWTPISTGDFQLALYGITQSLVADPYSNYDQYFTTNASAKVGEEPTKGQNYSRYTNPVVDAAVKQAGATQDEAIKKEAYAAVQAEIARDLPYIPVVLNASQSFFNTADFTGWPSESDMYAAPLPYLSTASAVILTHLRPAKK